MQTGMWSWKEAQNQHHFDEGLAKAIYGYMKLPKNIIDIGCGNGQYCKYFYDLGWKTIKGFDGTPNKWGNFDNIEQVDFTNPNLELPESDLVICLEVGEHIPKKYEDTFIKLITNCTSNILILSWAIPNQGGYGHVNECGLDYIIHKVSKIGNLVYLPQESFMLREMAELSWFKNNIIVFQRMCV